MILKCFALFIAISFLAGCSIFYSSKSKSAENVLLMCQSELEKITPAELLEQADKVYIHKFDSGYTVLFSHGAVGTFGKRDQKRSIGSCSITNEKIVIAYNHVSPNLSNELQYNKIEDYSQHVKEYLFVRQDKKFNFCCMQEFDEKNIDKHNPRLFKIKDLSKLEKYKFFSKDFMPKEEQLKIVHLALAEFRKNNLNISGYKLSIYRVENGYIAIFEDPNIPVSHRGSSPAMLSFGVEIDNNYTVIKSHFLR